MSSLYDLIDNRLSFDLVCSGLAGIERASAVDHRNLRHPVIRRRECIESSVVERPVGECDKALVTAPVVPCEEHLRHGDSKAVVEDALQVICLEIIIAVIDLLHEE